MRTFLLGAIAAAAGLPGAASAACVTIDPVVLPQLRVDPLDASGPGAATQPFTVTFRLEAAHRSGNQILATIASDYGGVTKQRVVDQIVVNHGTIPLDELYFELKPLSRNLGETSYDELIAGRAQSVMRNPHGQFQLFRIGDAVAARNTHAAIYDALRLAKDI